MINVYFFTMFIINPLVSFLHSFFFNKTTSVSIITRDFFYYPQKKTKTFYPFIGNCIKGLALLNVTIFTHQITCKTFCLYSKDTLQNEKDFVLLSACYLLDLFIDVHQRVNFWWFRDEKQSCEKYQKFHKNPICIFITQTLVHSL
jgi:hypothetical protein